MIDSIEYECTNMYVDIGMCILRVGKVACGDLELISKRFNIFNYLLFLSYECDVVLK